MPRCPTCDLDLASQGTGPLPRCSRCQGLVVPAGTRQVPLLVRGEDGAPGPHSTLELSGGFTDTYRLERVIGTGTMGMVFRAIHLSTGRRVAVKFLRPSQHPDIATRFKREGQFVSALEHPHVVRILDVGELAGHPYLVMELLEGGSLADRAAVQGKFEAPDAVRIVSECLDGLQACHERGIIHRDLKPPNILFTADGKAKIADFGIAHYAGELTSLTKTGALIGTPRYMSPEAILGEQMTGAADVYAMALILYELLTGRCPFVASSLDQILDQQLHGTAVPVHKLSPEVPEQLSTLVESGMAKRPADRPASAVEMARKLRQAVPQPTPPSRASGAREGRPSLPRPPTPGAVAVPASAASPAPSVQPSSLGPPRVVLEAGTTRRIVAVLLVGALMGGFVGGWLSTSTDPSPAVPTVDVSPASPPAGSQDPSPSPSAALSPAESDSRGQARVDEAQQLFECGHFREALDLLGPRARAAPQTCEAFLLAGRVYLALYRGDDAEVMLRAALNDRSAAASCSADARQTLGRYLISIGRLNEAERILEETLRRYEIQDATTLILPPHWKFLNDVHFALGELHRMRGRKEKARKEYQSALRYSQPPGWSDTIWELEADCWIRKEVIQAVAERLKELGVVAPRRDSSPSPR